MCYGGSLLFFSHLHDVASCVLEITEIEGLSFFLEAVHHA